MTQFSVEKQKQYAAQRVWAAQLEIAKVDVNVFITSSFKNDQIPGAPPFEQQWFHKEWQHIWLTEQMSVIHGATGFGKCLAPETLVLRKDGSAVRADEVQAGDELLGPDSFPRRVLGTTKGRGQMFRIVPTKGEPWVCNDVHVLTLVKSTTGEIVDIPLDVYLRKSKTFKHLHKLFFPALGVDFVRTLSSPIDPYFLGVWFGDGRKSLEHVVEVSKPDQEIEDACRATANKWGLSLTVDRREGACPSYRIVGQGKGTNALIVAMRELVGPLATVPDVILKGSRETRLAFLAGFLDTDGHTVSGGIDIVQKRKDYAEAVTFLARSLGLRAVSSTKQVNGFDYHRVNISGHTDRIPMRVARKVPAPRLQKKDPSRSGFTVEAIGEGDFAGFTLDGDGRFLLGDFTVTHNTEQKIGNLLFRMGKKPTIRIGLFGKMEENAVRLNRKLRRQIEGNPIVRHIFPALRPGPVWNDSRLRLAEAGIDTTTDTCTALGMGGSPAGMRLDVVDADDIVDDENTRTAEQREQTIERLDTVIQSRLTTEGQLHITANAWDIEDAPHVYGNRPGIYHGVYPAISESGELLWPEFRTREWLEQKRQTMSEDRFAQMFLCKARDENSRIFKDEWFQRARAQGMGMKPLFRVEHAFDHDWSLLRPGDLPDVPRLVEQELRVFIGVDLATGDTERKRKTDLTVFYVIGVDIRGRRRVLWIEKGRWDGGESIRRYRLLRDRYRPVNTLVESNGTQKFFLSWLRESIANLRVEPFVTTGEKWEESTGIENVGIELSRGQWIIPNPIVGSLTPQEQEAQDNIDEWEMHLKKFTRVGHTADDVMAMWFAQRGACRDAASIFQMQLPQAQPVSVLPEQWNPQKGWDLTKPTTVEAILDAPKVETPSALPEIPDHIKRQFGLLP